MNRSTAAMYWQINAFCSKVVQTSSIFSELIFKRTSLDLESGHLTFDGSDLHDFVEGVKVGGLESVDFDSVGEDVQDLGGPHFPHV